MKNILIFAAKRVGKQILEYLINKNYQITAVVVSNKNHKMVSQIAESNGLIWVTYRDFINNYLYYKGISWIVNAWSPYILPKQVLELADFRINIHPSLVPHAKGADSSAWILRKQLPCGVSLLEMNTSVDCGGIYVQQEVHVKSPLRGKDLHRLLQDCAVRLFKENWPLIYNGELKPKPQPPGGSAFTREQTNQDRVRSPNDFSDTVDMVRWMLAHDFYPKSTAQICFEGKQFRIALFPLHQG